MPVIDKIDAGGYDYIDFGCKEGEMFERMKEEFGVSKGLGLDINEEHVRVCKKNGHDAEVQDITKFEIFDTKKTRFVLMSHFLEHLFGYNEAKKCIHVACSLAKEFVYIRQPFFDQDGYLFNLGLKLYFSNWSGHPNRMTSLEFHNILHPLLRDNIIKRFCIYYKQLIQDSYDLGIHPIISPMNLHEYDVNKYPFKKYIVFDQKVYRDIIVLIFLNENHISLPKDLEEEIGVATKVFDSYQDILGYP